MFSNQSARLSVDSLSSPPSPQNARGEYPFHRQSSVTSHASARRGSTASSIHSIGGHLDTSNSWAQGVQEIGQNAISTLLQPPIVRTGLLPHTSAPASSAHKPPTARDIPPVTLTNIEKIDVAEFKPYLSQVGALYEQLRRVKESEDSDADQIFRRGSKADTIPSLDDGHLRPGSNGGRPSSSRKASTSSFGSASPLESPQIRRRSSAGFNRKGAQGPPPLNTIPNVYFDDDFHLENPRTFDVVSERSEVVKPPPGSSEEKSVANGTTAPRKSLATNAILQEKLSWYMDTIEIHLIASISTASTTFFTALGSLRELHSEAAESVDRIRTLRKELDALDQEIATTGLDIVQKRRRKENLQQLDDAVHQLREIAESLSECESQVDTGDIDQALTNIEALERLIAGRKRLHGQDNGRPIRDLRDAVALQGVNSDISSLRLRIGKAYETRFVDVLLEDLRRHVDTVSTQDVLLRWTSASMRSRGGQAKDGMTFPPAYLSSTGGLRSQLMPVVTGLHQAKHITMAIASYRELVLREIRKLIQKPLPSSDDDDNVTLQSASTRSGRKLTQQEKSSILARNLRALDPEDAEALFTKIYIGVTETLRRLTTQVKVMFDVASSIGEPPEVTSGMRSPPLGGLKSPPLNSANQDIQEDIHLTLDLANLLGQAADLAQEKITKVLRVRSEQSTRLPLDLFLRYFTLNLYFTNECESLSGRSGTPLKTVVNGHIKDYIDQHGDVEKQKLAQEMESDQWAAKDFGNENKLLLNRIIDSSTKDDVSWSEGSKIWIPYSNTRPEPNGRPRAESNGTAPRDKTRSAAIDSESFILPQSAILCLEGMSHFMQLIAGIPSMSSDIATSLVSYLQVFNSRCTQLILGAGATRSAGLKNITTRHLALAAQALAFISTLIPHVREFVRRLAGTGANVNNASVAALMGEFDKVKRLYQEHQNNIYDKLVEIMSGRAAAHTKTMKGLDWDRPAKEGEASVDVFMETLVKETVTLHRVLTKHLPEGTVHLIMSPVFDSYKTQLGKALQGLEVKEEIGAKRMENNIGYFINRLSKVEGFSNTGEHLLGIVQTKKPDKPPPVPEKNGTEMKPNDSTLKEAEKPEAQKSP
ncbi:Vps54-like protein-domain-containing protein [Apiospora saccharicola]|uniref:Vacuolar protein sorting-associated protein 54 n=1 Tax=Apiospora saccharicola TaxID=335842 RepID=A0ABR1TJA3_9PEZI